MGNSHRSITSLLKTSPVIPYDSLTVLESYQIPSLARIIVRRGDQVRVKTRLAEGVLFINKIFYIDMAKLLLSLVFIMVTFMVYRASRKRGLTF
jgi:hypothetical protein